jgi:uncharacterized protein
MEQSTVQNLDSLGIDELFRMAEEYFWGNGVEVDDLKAVEIYLKISKMDPQHADALARIGNCYYRGFGVEKDESLAVEYLKRAVNLNDSDGMYQLALAYSEGKGVQQDQGEAFRLFEKSAKLGHWHSQYVMGVWLKNGDVVDRDIEQAIYWFRKAAEQDHKKANFELGLLYMKGFDHIDRNIHFAIAYLQKSIDLGVTEAYFRLGMIYMYEFEDNISNNEKAFDFWKTGSELGQGACSLHIGLCYKHGKFVHRDGIEAVRWFEKAVEQGNIHSLIELGHAYNEDGVCPNQFEKSVNYYAEAYSEGSAEGAYWLGTMFEKGKGLEKDYSKAFELYEYAGENGQSKGFVQAGYLYYFGYGVEKNISKAIEYTERAQTMGLEDADNLLNLMYRGIETEDEEQFILDKAFRFNLAKAEKGDIEAQFQVYLAYNNGKGTNIDSELAYQWCKKAADNGHLNAQNNMGMLAQQRDDPLQAEFYLLKGCESGSFEAMNDLALLYLNNEDYFSNKEKKAIELLEAAATSGMVVSQKNIGSCYLNGYGVAKNIDLATQWLTKAADQGSLSAMYNLAKHVYSEGDEDVDYQIAEMLFRKIIEKQDMDFYDDALFGLAYLYSNKIFDHDKAFPLWLKLAEKGLEVAQFNLGLCYLNGEGTFSDEKKAKYWFNLSANQGFKPALKILEDIHSSETIPGNDSSVDIKKSSGGCYIATAVYGDYNSPEVLILRNFRDQVLSKNLIGTLFVRTYYLISPMIVRIFGKRKAFNQFWRWVLNIFIHLINKYVYNSASE